MQDLLEYNQDDQRIALLVHAFNNVDEAIFLVNENAEFLHINEKACQSLSYTREELLTMRLFDITPDFTLENWKHYKGGNSSGTIETRYKTKDGRIFPVKISASSIPHLAPEYRMLIVRDLSTDKEIDKQLHLLNYALDHVGEAAWLIDENTKFHYNNAEACRAIGYMREEMLQLGVPDIDPDYQLDIWPKHWQDLKKNGSLTFESRHRRRDGRIFPVEINANYFEFDGKGYNLALMRDITERKQMEEKLRQREQEFRILVESSPSPIIRYDANCRRVYVNPAVEKMLGKSSAELLNRVPSDGSILDKRKGEELEQTLRHVLETGQATETEIECVLANGQTHYFYNRYAPELDAHGKAVGVVLIGHDITERKQIERQMEYHASYDTLTGLPNRRMFNNRLRIEIFKAERSDIRVALFFIDLDNFKEVNDMLGHKTGDYLLIEAAKRIQFCVRETDTVARLGGDEFVVILPEAGLILSLEHSAKTIIDALAQPFKFGEHVIYISASLGIAVYPQDAVDGDTLMGCADQAMYAAKELGRNNVSCFTRSMQQRAHERLMLINNLRLAIEKEQLHLYYQPIVDISTGKIVKAEALIRWIHPTLGMVSPATFIPLAEETNLIQEIGTWVFHQAAKTAHQWNLHCVEDKHFKISINMSPRQLIKGDGDQMAIAYLQKMNINPSFVVIEITEGLLLDNSPQILEKLERLQAIGIELSLDDFGTGYSAIAYLKKFNLNYLKIDRSFVKDLEIEEDDVAIAEAIVVMAHRLGLKIIAEGVETQGQRDLLATAGCEYIQGYFYAKPMPKEAFLSFTLH